MDEPDFLTVEEAARVLRIGRTTAYKEAKRFLATNGAEGIPVCPVGGLLRVPRARLEQLAGGRSTGLRDERHARTCQRPRSATAGR